MVVDQVMFPKVVITVLILVFSVEYFLGSSLHHM